MEPFSYAPNGTVDFNPPIPAMLYGTQLAEEVSRYRRLAILSSKPQHLQFPQCCTNKTGFHHLFDDVGAFNYSKARNPS